MHTNRLIRVPSWELNIIKSDCEFVYKPEAESSERQVGRLEFWSKILN